MTSKINQSNNVAFINIETSGVSHINDRIIGIGVVRVSKNSIQEWEQIINPGFTIESEIEEITGISNTDLEIAPIFANIADDLLELLSGCLFVSHNAKFEYDFLKSEFERLDKPFDLEYLSTMNLSRQTFPEFKNHDLDSIIQRFNLSHSDKNSPLSYASVVRQLWEKLVS